MPTEIPAAPQNPETPQQPTITNPPPEGENPTEKRIKALSGKVEVTATERDAALASLDKAEKLQKFSDEFLTTVATNPGALEHKTQIQEKVLGGYTIQDATYAVLGPLGKLGNQQPMAPITGGSAPTIIPNQGQKPYSEQNREELRAAMFEAQKKGDLSLS